jgi:hypothetical protein
LCVEFPGDTTMSPEDQAALRQLVDEIGIERFEELLGRWFIEGYRGTQP